MNWKIVNLFIFLHSFSIYSQNSSKISLIEAPLNPEHITKEFSISNFFDDPGFQRDPDVEYFLKRKNSGYSVSYSYIKSIENGLVAYTMDLRTLKDTVAVLNGICFHKTDGLCDPADNFYAIAFQSDYANMEEFRQIISFYRKQFGEPVVEWNDTIFKKYQHYSWNTKDFIYKVFQEKEDEIKLYILNANYLDKIKEVNLRVWYDAFQQ